MSNLAAPVNASTPHRARGYKSGQRHVPPGGRKLFRRFENLVDAYAARVDRTSDTGAKLMMAGLIAARRVMRLGVSNARRGIQVFVSYTPPDLVWKRGSMTSISLGEWEGAPEHPPADVQEAALHDLGWVPAVARLGDVLDDAHAQFLAASEQSHHPGLLATTEVLGLLCTIFRSQREARADGLSGCLEGGALEPTKGFEDEGRFITLRVYRQLPQDEERCAFYRAFMEACDADPTFVHKPQGTDYWPLLRPRIDEILKELAATRGGPGIGDAQ